jgi:hypothetical protein
MWEIAPDGANHDFSRVQADADLDRDPLRPAHTLRVAFDRVLHTERRIAGARRVILMGQRRAEERHDAIAHDLIHRTLEAVDRLHHVLENRIEELPRLLRVTVREELHRALEIGEEYGHLLALALERGLRGEDLLGTVLRGV